MLIKLDQLLDMSVVSLETGQELARTTNAIIDPRSLAVVAFYVEGKRLDYDPAVLFVSDIRDFGRMGLIIDGSEKILSPDDLVRLEIIINFDFKLINKIVKSKDGITLGKVSSIIIDTPSYIVKQLEVTPTFFNSITRSALLVHRNQIIKVTNKCIVVKMNDTKSHGKLIKKEDFQLASPFRSLPAPGHAVSSIKLSRISS
jgi:uncharacterized protein YrrD